MTIETIFGWLTLSVDGKSASGGTWILAKTGLGSEVPSEVEVRLGELVGKYVRVVFQRWSRSGDLPRESGLTVSGGVGF